MKMRLKEYVIITQNGLREDTEVYCQTIMAESKPEAIEIYLRIQSIDYWIHKVLHAVRADDGARGGVATFVYPNTDKPEETIVLNIYAQKISRKIDRQIGR